MGDDSGTTEQTDARAMLDIFAGVGAAHFDVTWTNASGDKQRFRRGMSLADLAHTLPAILHSAEREQHNVIVRPDGPGVTFIQLDDLKADQLSQLAPAVFLTLETSPGNYQAWAALSGLEDKDFARRLRKGTGADATASGATRIAGSLNFKDKYAPDFPRVAIHAAQPGRMTNADELDRLGLVAAPEILPPFVPPARISTGGRKWPSYGIALDRAPLNSEGTGPDTSHADIAWCMIAVTWGFGVEETARRLMEEPDSKAHKRGQKYADDTARKAALFVQQRRDQRHHRTAEHARR